MGFDALTDAIIQIGNGGSFLFLMGGSCWGYALA